MDSKTPPDIEADIERDLAAARSAAATAATYQTAFAAAVEWMGTEQGQAWWAGRPGHDYEVYRAARWQRCADADGRDTVQGWVDGVSMIAWHYRHPDRSCGGGDCSAPACVLGRALVVDAAAVDVDEVEAIPASLSSAAAENLIF